MTAAVAEKNCSRCGLLLPADRFSPDRRREGGLRAACKGCVNLRWREARLADPGRFQAYEKRRRASGQQRDALLRHRYGMGSGDYERLVRDQAGGCAICGRTRGSTRTGRLCVDHDHATNRVRGLLCSPCNRAIGHLGDSVHGLRDALAYLERAGD